MSKVGRPEKEVDWDRVDELCALQATEKEIAADQGMSVSTFIRKVKARGYENFTELFQERRQPGLTDLRSKQYEVAMQGDKTMLVWLGKNWLDQTDKQHTTVEDTGPTKIIYEVEDPDEY